MVPAHGLQQQETYITVKRTITAFTNYIQNGRKMHLLVWDLTLPQKELRVKTNLATVKTKPPSKLKLLIIKRAVAWDLVETS